MKSSEAVAYLVNLLGGKKYEFKLDKRGKLDITVRV